MAARAQRLRCGDWLSGLLQREQYRAQAAALEHGRGQLALPFEEFNHPH